MDQNNNLNAYHSDMPYPEVKVSGKNKLYADLLRGDYAGFVSEMTASNQYSYHHFVSREENKEISEMLINIAIVEMNHFEVLARLIFLLGEEPTYFAQDNYWNAEYVFYGKNLLEQLEADLQSEYDAIENYEKTIERIDDPYIITVLKRIILDEEVHVRLFKKAIEMLKEEQKPKETLTDVIEQAFPTDNQATF